MTATAPECPSCCAPMRLASDLAAAGLSRSWDCSRLCYVESRYGTSARKA